MYEKDEIRDWIFTFGFGHKYPNGYTVINGTYDSARDKMRKLFGNMWAFQYDSEESAGVAKYNLTKIKPPPYNYRELMLTKSGLLYLIDELADEILDFSDFERLFQDAGISVSSGGFVDVDQVLELNELGDEGILKPMTPAFKLWEALDELASRRSVK